MLYNTTVSLYYCASIVQRARTEPEPVPLCAEPTLDWGLKTKVRLVSPHSFDWAKVKRVRQESQGLAAFIQGHTDTLVRIIIPVIFRLQIVIITEGVDIKHVSGILSSICDVSITGASV